MIRPNVAFGSNPEVELADADFRFTPQSRHPAVGLGCPFSACQQADIVDALKPEFASRVWGAAVFQVHIGGSEGRYEEDDFKDAIATTENTIKAGLVEHGQANSGYNFSFHPLQSKNEGYTARQLEPDGDELAWGQHGHATRYYAVLIKSKVIRPKPAKTIAEHKARMHG